jgi:hypothetical protein
MLARLVGRACGMLQTVATRQGRRRPDVDLSPPPVVVGKAHFAAANLPSEQRSARVA